MHDGRHTAKLYRTFITNPHVKPVCTSLGRTHDHQEKNPCWESHLEASVITVKVLKFKGTAIISLSIHLSFHFFSVSTSGTKQPHHKIKMSNSYQVTYEMEMKITRRTAHHVQGPGVCMCRKEILIPFQASNLAYLSIHLSLLSLWVSAKGFRKGVCKLWRHEMLHIFTISYIALLTLLLSYRHEGLYIQ